MLIPENSGDFWGIICCGWLLHWCLRCRFKDLELLEIRPIQTPEIKWALFFIFFLFLDSTFTCLLRWAAILFFCCVISNTTLPPWPCCTLVSLSLSCPHLAAASLRPATPHQMEAPGQKKQKKKLTASSPPRGGWVSRSEHLPPCFYYHSQPPSPSLIRNHRLIAVETLRAVTPAFYRKRVERSLGFSCVATGHSGVIDVPAGVTTQVLRVKRFILKRCAVGVGARSIARTSDPFTAPTEPMLLCLHTNNSSDLLINCIGFNDHDLVPLKLSEKDDKKMGLIGLKFRNRTSTNINKNWSKSKM